MLFDSIAVDRKKKYLKKLCRTLNNGIRLLLWVQYDEILPKVRRNT